MALEAVTIQQARKILSKAFKVKRPVFIKGPAGVGKSELVESIANDGGAHLIDIRLSQVDQVDLRGLPFFNKESGLMEWAHPVELPTKELAAQYPFVILFLDEMNSAAPSVQAAAYQLILNRRLGTYTLPDNVVMVAAGNRSEDNGLAFNLLAPLANRFVHIEIKSDFQSWFDWAINRGIHEDVVGYLSFAKKNLHNYNPNSGEDAFPTPRTWTFVSEFLEDDDCDFETLHALVSGAVGSGAAVEFLAHRKHAKNLPNPTDILSGKVTTLKTKEISAMYTLTISMCYELKAAQENGEISYEKFHEMCDYFFGFMMDNFESELTVMGARVALKHYDLQMDTGKLKNFNKFYEKFGKFIINAKS